jgi:hypothetical protein
MLTLLETADQVRWFAQHSPEDVRNGNVLAITPEAAYVCQQLKVPYLKLEDHAQVFKRAVEYTSILPCYLEWEEWLDEWTQQAIPEFGKVDFKPASAVTFLLQLLFAEIWATATSLREFLEALRPNRVALWPPVITHIPWYLQPSVSPLSAILPRVASASGIEVITLSAQTPELTPVTRAEVSSYFKRLLKWSKRQLRQSWAFSEWAALRASGLAAYLKQFDSDAPRILISGFGYDLTPLAGELRQRSARVVQLLDELPPARLLTQSPPLPAPLRRVLAAAGSRLLEEPNLWKPLEQWGLGRTPLWAMPLHFWWYRIVPELWINFQRVRRLLQSTRPAALITWDAGANTLSGAAVNAATAVRVVCCVYQHGGSSGSDAKIWQMYLRHTDSFLVYGQQTLIELQQSCPPSLNCVAELIPVGSARLDLIRQQHLPEKSRQLRARLRAGDSRPIILYVPTVFATYGRAIGDLAAYPDVSYFELQQIILKLWLEAPEIRLLYKELIVANDPNRVMPEFIRKYIPNGTVTRQRLTDLMWAVDAIVVDHAITALSEVLLTNKPLIVYMPKPNAAGPQAKILLQKRAAVAETPDEFAAHVRALLHAGRYPELENPNDEFLQAYCTHLNDGRSAERAAEVILDGRIRDS